MVVLKLDLDLENPVSNSCIEMKLSGPGTLSLSQPHHPHRVVVKVNGLGCVRV